MPTVSIHGATQVYSASFFLLAILLSIGYNPSVAYFISRLSWPCHTTTCMSPEHYQPGSTDFLSPTPDTREVLFDIEARNIDQAAEALAHGELVVMQLYTLGLLVDGTNEAALQKLFAAKHIPYERALRGERPIVSILPAPEHRTGLIAVERHHPHVQEVLTQEDHHLLTPDGHALFYRIHVGEAGEYLRVPLIAEEPTGERTMVLLWHDNPYVRLLEERARAIKGDSFLLTGSSANPTGQPQPTRIENLHASMLPHITTVVDLQDEHIAAVPEEIRGAIPIINLVGHPPTIMRPSPMYEPIPAHLGLQALIGSTQDPQAA